MIRNDDELQSLMFLGWDVFLKRACAMDTACGERPWKTTQYDFYTRLNDAMRQSIRNYLG